MRKSNASREARPPLRLFVNPLAVWTDLMLKGGGVVLASMQAAAARARAEPEAKAVQKGKSRTKTKRRAKAKRR